MTRDGIEHLLFTGSIYAVGARGAYRVLHLTDSYHALMSIHVTPAYRKETARAILQDILTNAEITKTSITCPNITLARFSAGTIPASECIAMLINALEEHGHIGLRYFFDAGDTFRFGTIQNTGKNDGEIYNFRTGRNILKKADGHIEILPLPIRHSQSVTVDGKEYMTRRTELIISGSRSSLIIWLEEAS
jgi:hypothetical protein